ncbi:UNVERIFIED_CONTAM: protein DETOXIFICATION 26, partial [Sesamum latifolium]
IRVANEIGAGNGNSAKFAVKVSVFNSLVVGFVFFLVIIAFPDKIAMIFTSSSSVISMVEGLALLLAITILFNCIQPIFQGIWAGMICGTMIQTLILTIVTIRYPWGKEANVHRLDQPHATKKNNTT